MCGQKCEKAVRNGRAEKRAEKRAGGKAGVRKSNMAKSAVGLNFSEDPPKELIPTIYSVRCRLCRRHLLSSDKVTNSHEKSPELCGNCLYLEEDELPPWIENEVELSGWTKGRIYCPAQNCTARIGGFNFVQGLRCACGVFTIPAIWMQDGKVDVNTISSNTISSNTVSSSHGQAGRGKPDKKKSTPCKKDPDFRNPKVVQMVATVAEALAREDKYQKSSEECRKTSRNEHDVFKTERHIEPNRSTFVFHRRDPQLVPSRNRLFKKLKIEEPKLVPPPSPKEVDDHLLCPICLECFYKPYQCPCSHVFCEPCLQQLYHARCGTLKCPVCRSPVRYVEPANELRGELQKFHCMATKAREKLENSAKYKSWPLPPTGPLEILKRRRPLVPSTDMKFIVSAGILLLVVWFVILYTVLNV